MASLIDPTQPFGAVYALFPHEQLGFLLGAYAVQKTHSAAYGLKYNRLLPEAFDRYAHVLDSTDRQLTTLLSDLVLHNLFKKFKRKEKSLKQFLDGFRENPHQSYIRDYIQRRMTQALELLSGRDFYLMSRDGYPAFKPLTIHALPAQVAFTVRRTPYGVEYSAELRHNHNTLLLHTRPGGVVGHQPAWILTDDLLLRVDGLPDGKKLTPFFKHEAVKIPKTREGEFFEKFIKKLLADNEVHTEGFEVQTIEELPQLELELQRESPGILSLKPRVRYADKQLALNPNQPHAVELTKPNGQYKFVRIARQEAEERRFLAALTDLRGNQPTLGDISLPEAEAHAWVVAHHEHLAAAGIQLVQKLGEEAFLFDVPELTHQLTQHGNAFILSGHISVGGADLPLQELRGRILKGDGKLQLPDGRYVFLPNRWLRDFRHLMEVAKPTEQGLRLERYQLGILKQALKGRVQLDGALFADFDTLEEVELPQGLQATLRDYQKAGYDWLTFLHRYGVGGILADDMGLGKTLQTLCILQAAKEKGELGTSLIVVPNSMLFNRTAVAQKFTPGLSTLIYKGPKRKDRFKEFGKTDLVLTTYGTLRQDAEPMREVAFAYVVLDESHIIKNREAKTTQAVLKLNARHRLSLTGTPIENSTMDLWTQMEFLNPGLLGSATFFERYYAMPIEKEQNEERAAQLHDLTRPFLMRRTKDMVAKDLPERIEHVQTCEMSEAQAALYLKTASLYRKTLFIGQPDNELNKNKMQVLSSIQRLRQIAIHPQLVDPRITDSGKYEVMWERMEEVLAGGGKVLIFSQFVKLLKILQADLLKRGLSHSYLDGSLSTEARAREVNRFQDDDNVRIFLISLKAGGVGLNLTAAQYVFLLDPWWNPAIEQQAINRAHRIGQTSTVFVYKFITVDSIEEKILKMQQQKLQLAQDVIKSEAQFFKALTRDDLESLFA